MFASGAELLCDAIFEDGERLFEAFEIDGPTTSAKSSARVAPKAPSFCTMAIASA